MSKEQVEKARSRGSGTGRPRSAVRHGGKRVGAGGKVASSKVRELAEKTGISHRDAARVVSGKMTVAAVLKEMMQREKLRPLIDRGELEESLAGQVVRGMITLDKGLLMTRLHKTSDWRGTQSLFDDLLGAGETAMFFMFGREPFEANVKENLKYDVVLMTGDDQIEKVVKHDIIMVCKKEELDELLSARTVDGELAKQQLGPSTSFVDRFRSRKETLFDLHEKQRAVRVTFRDGTILEGRMGWFGKWEVQLVVSEGCAPVVFLHAFHAFVGLDNEGKSE